MNMTNHPDYYSKNGIEPIDLIDAFNLNFNCGNVIKYITAERGVLDMKNVNVIQCKECKHFQKNSWANFDGIPLIVAHEICTFWGNGCKTNPEGYCFAGEVKEVEKN